MPDKKFSSAQGAPSQDKVDNKSKAAPATAKSVTQPDQKPAAVTPAPKS
jgi:hypothetical protein